MKDLVPIGWSNQRVLTTKQLADFYGVSVYRIKDNFRNAREHFVEGVHYFKLVGAAILRRLRERVGSASLFGRSASCLILWTKQGAARHAKMLNTQRAWEVFTELEQSYFAGKTAEPFVQSLFAEELLAFKDQPPQLNDAPPLLLDDTQWSRLLDLLAVPIDCPAKEQLVRAAANLLVGKALF